MKSIFTSKTMWINAIAIASTWFLNHQGVMKDIGLDADTQVTILAAVNVLLRWVTNTGVYVAAPK